MMATTLNRNRHCRKAMVWRSHGRFQRMTVSSSSWTPDICARRMSRMPQRANRTADTASPAKPHPPKQPKNCHSSCPDTKPAPKKQPAKRKASLGTLSCFTKPLPFFNLSHYIIFPPP